MTAMSPTDPVARASHWDSIYTGTGDTGLSWYQAHPSVSLELIDALGIPSTAAIIDVGGGTSLLVDNLLARGYTDVSVLDVSRAALDLARQRPAAAATSHWLNHDVLTWQPSRQYQLWHDRAVFHFLVDAADQDRYLRTLREALEPDGAVILASFARDGPDHCSGLPVARRDTADLEDMLEGFTVVQTRREEHVTPRGVRQPFSWVAARAGCR
jgi:trans-aconitate methyltransferase